MTTDCGLDFISSNAEAQRALMNLHPCKLMRLEQSHRSSPMPAAKTGAHSDSAVPSAVPGSLTSDDAAAQQKQSAKQGRHRLRQPAADPSTYNHIRQEQVGLSSLANTGDMPPSQYIICDSSAPCLESSNPTQRREVDSYAVAEVTQLQLPSSLRY